MRQQEPAEVPMERRKIVVDLQQIDLLEQKIVKATELIRTLRRERESLLAKVKETSDALATDEFDAVCDTVRDFDRRQSLGASCACQRQRPSAQPRGRVARQRRSADD